MFTCRPLLVVGVFVLLASMTSALNLTSPCPHLFHYDSEDQPKQWTGTVTLLSDVELHGIWVRLIFDGKLRELDVHDNFGDVVLYDDLTGVLIKNRTFHLKPGTPTYVKVTVKYDGDKIPTLTGYRLNARMVCSSQDIKFGQTFPGDLNNKDFLTSITSQVSAADKGFEGCGTTPLSANQESTNKPAQSGQWPWQGAISIQNNNVEKYICGATLVSPKHVLTPAHCVTYQASELPLPVSQLSVFLGKLGYSERKEEHVQKLAVKNVVLYPGYRTEQLLNDLAVIELDKSAVINDYVRPICLGHEQSKIEGILLGYGINKDKIDDLTQTKVTTLNEEECLKKHPELSGLLTDNVICASYVKDDTLCVGDSGAGLVSLREGQKSVWELKGIVTVGVALQDKYVCNPESRLLLVDVGKYVKWIRSVVF